MNVANRVFDMVNYVFRDKKIQSLNDSYVKNNKFKNNVELFNKNQKIINQFDYIKYDQIIIHQKELIQPPNYFISLLKNKK